MEDINHVAVIDFGSAYSQLLVRRVRELGYYSKLYPWSAFPEIGKPAAVLLTGTFRGEEHPGISFSQLQALGVPVLGVDYGMDWLNGELGGTGPGLGNGVWGGVRVNVENAGDLLEGVERECSVWAEGGAKPFAVAEGGEVLARAADGAPMAVKWGKGFYGVKFHPEVTQSEPGLRVIGNFLSQARELASFEIGRFKDELLESIPQRVGGRQVVCGVSGGVDSTVLAVLLHRAGVNMRAIFVDHGLMRKDEGEEIRRNFARLGVTIETVDASQRFLDALKGETDPEKKRNIIGNLFIDVFWEAVGDAQMLAQGTVYPDVIESAASLKSEAKVKTHHNRVKRILELQAQGKLLEPLADLFKGEVRALGEALQIPHDMVYRHPFPGPGLGVRCPGEVTKERLEILRECDAIFIGLLRETGWYDKVWQAYAALLPMKSVGVRDGMRSYDWCVSLRAIMTEDAMTADWVELPYHLLRRISSDILKSVPGVNRVFYDISPKPPASIELE